MNIDPEVGFEKIQETFVALSDAIERAEKDNNALPDCFVYAQLVDNQKDYFKELFSGNREYETKIAVLEVALKSAYEKLFPIYDRLSDSEMIELIYRALEVLVGEYEKKFGLIGEMTNEQLIEIFTLRDQIKILFDELEVWADKFEQKEQIAFEKHSVLFQKMSDFDSQLRDELVIHNRFHVPIYEEAERRLIRKPNGIERYNFWWWHAGQ